jgi:CPA2 family monovalent cation:H+ antiporter-2
VTVGVLLPVVAIVLWRSAANLQGHVKAGAELIVEVLVAHARKGLAASGDESLEQVRQIMPGLGEPVPLRLEDGSPAVGKTLAELNLRGLTGTSVLAIVRGEQGVIFPLASELLRGGDILALAGTREAVAAATEILRGPAIEESAGAEPGGPELPGGPGS